MSFNPPPPNNQRPDQNSLLRFGIEHAAPGAILAIGEDVKAGRRPDLNTKMLKHIMGKTNADRMIECVGVIDGRWIDPETDQDLSADITLEDKLKAWVDLEMLVQDLDNSGDLKFNNLWKPIVAHLSDTEDQVRAHACWVLGTAVQNDPKSKDAFLELDPLPTVISLVNAPGNSDVTRNKAMYCISGTLKHSAVALARFNELNGWTVLNQALQDPSASLRAKTAFLLGSLVIQADDPTAIISSMRASSIISTLITSFTSASLPTGPNGDVDTMNGDYKQKALRVLVNIAEAWGFEAAERKLVLEVVTTMETEGLDLEECELAEADWKDFKASLSSSTRPSARAPVPTGSTDAYGLTPGTPDRRQVRPVLHDGQLGVSSAGVMLVDHTAPGFTGRSSATAAVPYSAARSQDNSLLFSADGELVLDQVPASAPQYRLATNNLDRSILMTSDGLVALELVPDESEEVPATNRRVRIPHFLNDSSMPMTSTGSLILEEESDDEAPAS